MSLGTIALIVPASLLIGVIPPWPHSRSWGYGPSGGMGVVLAIIVIDGPGTNCRPQQQLPTQHQPLAKDDASAFCCSDGRGYAAARSKVLRRPDCRDGFDMDIGSRVAGSAAIHVYGMSNPRHRNRNCVRHATLLFEMGECRDRLARRMLPHPGIGTDSVVAARASLPEPKNLRLDQAMDRASFCRNRNSTAEDCPRATG